MLQAAGLRAPSAGAFVESPIIVESTLLPVPRPEEVDTVLYHRSCMDGMTAAWAAWKLLGGRADYVPITYGDPPPVVAGKNVAVVDFNLSRGVVETMLASARSFILLDHHDSAEAELAGVPNTVVDLGRSGARLSWAFFHPEKPVPDLVRYADDYDRYRFELPHSRAYNAYVASHPLELQAYDRLSQLATRTIISRGTPLWQIVDKVANSQAEKAVWRQLRGYRALVANVTAFPNETADVLKARKDCDVAFLWHYDHERRHFKISLRSNGGVDVKAIAESFPGGGGGHKSAAGFRWAGEHIEGVFD